MGDNQMRVRLWNYSSAGKSSIGDFDVDEMIPVTPEGIMVHAEGGGTKLISKEACNVVEVLDDGRISPLLEDYWIERAYRCLGIDARGDAGLIEEARAILRSQPAGTIFGALDLALVLGQHLLGKAPTQNIPMQD